MGSERQGANAPSSTPVGGDPAQFVRGIEATGRFQRDGGIGRILHPGTVSYRELVPENSLHVVVDGDGISAHIDRVSPLGWNGDGPAHYSFWRTALHNVWGATKDFLRLLGGRRGDGRCEPACEWVDVDDALIDRLLQGDLQESGSAGAALGRLLQELSSGTAEGVRRVPFNVIDEIVDLLDTDAEPWSVHLEARIAGRLDDARLRAAIQRALRRHPMARARKVASPRTAQRLYWEIAGDIDVDPLQVRDCPDDAALEAARARLQNTRVPLSSSPPLRLCLARHPAGDVLMMNLHHAAADGFGALRILRSVARAYAGDDDPVPDVDYLAARDLAQPVAKADASTRLRRYLALAERLRDLVVSPTRLARTNGEPVPGYGLHHVRLDAEQTRALVGLDHPGSVNDVLLAALHLACAAWNARHGQPSRRISVLVPANLRPSEWRDELVGNFSLPARISTLPRQRTSPRAALETVTTQTRRKKRSGMGTALLEALNRSWLLPRWAKQGLVATPLLTKRFADTAVLSNLGNLAQPPSFGPGAGDTDELWFSAPARMPLGLSVGAITVAGRLHLVLRYRRAQFDPDAARRFGECYLAELRGIVDAVSS